MAGKSTFLANKQLDQSLGKASWTMPATIAAALCTVVPGAGDTGATIVEATYTGYARKVIAAADLNAAVAGLTTNANPLTWPACTGGASTIVAIAILDSSTIGAGNLLRWGVVALAVSVGITPSIPAGNLAVTES